MKETSTRTVAEHFGTAPFDYLYIGESELTDDHGEKVYAQAAFWPDGNTVFGVAKHSIDEDAPDTGPKSSLIEEYKTLEDAGNSAYFQYFLELDKLTDKKAAETMAQINDTKNYGFRAGAGIHHGRLVQYAEAYNANQPELNEYIQIRQTGDGYIYSASHKSYYMQTELEGLDAIYAMYFGKEEKPLYLFEIKSLDELGKYGYFRSSFEQMQALMKKHFEALKGEDHMNKITELSRRSRYHDGEGIVCGPVSISTAEAEIVVEDSGKKVYLFGEWVSESPDEVLFEATKKSIYDIQVSIDLAKDDTDEKYEELDAVREDTIDDWFPGCDIEKRYAVQHEEILKMLQAELEKNS